MQVEHFSFKSFIKELLYKSKDQLLNIFASPYLLSIFLFFIIIISLPQIFNKYTVVIVSKNKEVRNQLYYYADLDNDNVSEKINIQKGYIESFSLQVTQKDKIIDQWKFGGKLIATDTPFWFDYNGDNMKELAIFTYRDNRIFLNCFSPFNNKIFIKDREIIDYYPFDKNPDCVINIYDTFDSNNDGIKELFFFSNVGYSLQPRKMFKYDFANDSLSFSEVSCASITNTLPFYSGNNKKNYFTVTNAVGNCGNDSSYSDMFAWLMKFNTDMKYISAPVKIGVYPSYPKTIPFKSNNKENFIVMNIYTGNKNYPCTISLYNSDIEKIKEKQFTYIPQEWESANLYYDAQKNPDYFFIIKTNGIVEKIDEDLNILEQLKLPQLDYIDYYLLDIDQDGDNEIIFMTKDFENMIICRNDFADFIQFNLQGAGRLNSCTVKLNGTEHSELFAQFDNYACTIIYQANTLFYLKYPIYACIYLCVYLIILLLQKTQKHRAEILYTTKKRLAELQLLSIKNQIDPHFTLNIINTIGALYNKQDIDKADYIFGKYSKMLRTTILHSDKIITTLDSELNFVKNYLDLEQFRQDNKFNYEFKIDSNINLNLNVPKMIMHTFVENSVKHGLRHLERGGKLLLTIKKADGLYEILISDNGIGRKEAKSLELGNTNKGLDIIDQITDLYFKLSGIRITYFINDLFDKNEVATGTEVNIKIPVN